MLVRCGRCRLELEVTGPGEFVCPNCGARNAVRGAQEAAPFDLPDLGGGSPPPLPDEPTDVRWVVCPSCSYRFAVGPVERVACPACASDLELSDDQVRINPG